MIPFKNIPSTLRTPLFYAELDASKANTAQAPQRALLIGQKLPIGTLVADQPVIIQSTAEAAQGAGQGSILAGMIHAYRANDPTGELWVLPLADAAQETQAVGSITFSGTTTAAGALALYVAGRLTTIPIASGQTAAQVATTVAAALSAVPDLVVTAAVSGQIPAAVILTAKNAGLCGNDIDVRVNYLGAAGGEVLPQGLGAGVSPLVNAVANPSLVNGLAALNDTSFDFIACALTDATSMAAIAGLLNDTTGRWSWQTQVYGHCFIAARGTAGTLAAYASGLNNQHISCIGYADSPTPPWKWAAALAGAAAVSLRADPGVPLQYLTLAGVKAPPLASRFPLPIRSATLLYGGVSTWTADGSNTVTLENVITTYVTNAQGQPDDSYLQVETLFLLMFVLRRLRSVVSDKFGRVKLAADGVRLQPGANVVTPSTIKAELIAQYRQLEGEGMVQQADAFAAGLVVQKNASNPNRVDVLLPAVLIDQLRVFAVLVQFRLQ